MRTARRILVSMVIGTALMLVLAGPAAAKKVKLHDGTVLSCYIEHQAGILQDIINIRMSEAKADKMYVSKLNVDGPIELSVAMFYLTHSAFYDVIDGSDKAKFNKKGKADVEMTFNSFGTYEVDITISHKGFKPATDSFKFQVTDTNGGACHMVA
jgi:hypothetical protein